MGFEPLDPEFESKLKESFDLQGAMKTLGVHLGEVAPGAVTLGFEYSDKITQHHGFVHAGVLATTMDSAAGYAAATLMDAEKNVLTVEFKASWLRPAQGERFECRGRVIKPGRTLTFTEAEAYAIAGDQETLVATMTATMIAV